MNILSFVILLVIAILFILVMERITRKKGKCLGCSESVCHCRKENGNGKKSILANIPPYLRDQEE